jgi:hypothetical protein
LDSKSMASISSKSVLFSASLCFWMVSVGIHLCQHQFLASDYLGHHFHYLFHFLSIVVYLLPQMIPLLIRKMSRVWGHAWQK